MNPVLVRVDHRLLHGQVAVGWVPHLGAKHLWIADDSLAADDFAREITESAVPPGLDLEIFPVSGGAQRLQGPVPSRTILLLRTPTDLLRLVREGFAPGEANIGGLHWREGARRFLDFIHVTPEDISALEELVSRGVHLVARDLPGNPAVDLSAAIADGRLEFDHLPVSRS